MNPSPSGIPRRDDSPPVLTLRTKEARTTLHLNRDQAKKKLCLRQKTGRESLPPKPVVPPAGPPDSDRVALKPVPGDDPMGSAGAPPVLSTPPVPPSTLLKGLPEISPSSLRPTPLPVVPVHDGKPPSTTVGVKRPDSGTLRLRKKPSTMLVAGRESTLGVVANPACYNCRVSFDLGEELKPLAGITCPRCGAKQIVPATIDNLVLERKLGQGGMGTTFRAFDTSLLRNVAVKLITETGADNRQTNESMIREARRAAALSHPHIVPIYSIGSVAGMSYVVMELLSDRLFYRPVDKETPLEEIFVLQTGLAIARALACAADVGILHLDIKPANILHDRLGVAKLIDFGLARHVHNATTEIWGTCLYIPPERLSDNVQIQDLRSDQYSLGLTLWHALAGKDPLSAATEEKLIEKILSESPPVLSDLRPDLNPWTCGIIHKMISYEPTNRYPTYHELIRDLEVVIETLR